MKEFLREDIGVHLDHRNEGIGRRLMMEIEKCARDNNCNKIWLTVVPSMEKAIHLYKKLGYKKGIPKEAFL